MKFHSIDEAQKKKLVAITTARRYIQDEIDYIERFEKDLISKGRTTMPVKYKDGRIALFVNDICSNPRKDISSGKTYISRSRLYNSIRHLAECAFSKDKDFTLEQFIKLMKKEYPNCKVCRNGTFKPNYLLYRHHIVIQYRFQYVKKPRWAR